MKTILLFLLLPLAVNAQADPVDFSSIDSPTTFIGKTDHGMSLFSKNDDGKMYYRLTFPVYLEDEDQGFNHIDFFASESEFQSLYVFMNKSVEILGLTPHHEIGAFKIEFFTPSKEVNGVLKRLGTTKVSISKANNPSLKGQLGYFTITKSQVGHLFGKQKL